MTTATNYAIGNRVALADLNHLTSVITNKLGTVIAMDAEMIEVRLDSAISLTDTCWHFRSAPAIISIS